MIEEKQYAEAFSMNANYLTVYKKFETVNENSVLTYADNFRDSFHDCQMSAGAVKAIKKSVNIIMCMARRRYIAEKQKAYYHNKQRKAAACTSYNKNDITAQARIAANWQKAAYTPKKSKHLCTFVTLTLQSQQEHTDTEITQYLINPFLAYARKYFGVRYYIWKKELQKNGNLHFHFVCDRYIDHEYLRRTWNRICNRGAVSGVKTPFRYVDNYTANMLKLYGNGFDFKAVKEMFEKSPWTAQEADDARKDFEAKKGRDITPAEYDKIFNDIVAKKFGRAYDLYNIEMKKPAADRWRNPNSTDISAVSNPRLVAAYVGKYLTKEIDECPAVANYIDQVSRIKEQLRFAYKEYNEHQFNEQPTDDDLRNIEFWRGQLEAARQNCPILGKLWFKSLTLTPFLNGAKALMHDFIIKEVKDKDGKPVTDDKGRVKFTFIEGYDYSAELHKLRAYLEALSKKRGRSLIIKQFELDENGNETEKVLTTTLLINTSDLKKIGCPMLYRLWREFLFECLDYNRRRGLYERPDDYFNNYKAA